MVDDEDGEEIDVENQVFFRTIWDPAKWDKCPKCDGSGFMRARSVRDAAIVIAGRGYAPFPCRYCHGAKYVPKPTEK
jgi:DnaJ-class molecular chaperone